MELQTCSHSVPVINALTNTCTLSHRGVHAYVLLVSPWLNVLQTGLACGGTIFRQICLSPQMQKLWYFSVLYYDRCWTYLTCFGFIRIASFKKKYHPHGPPLFLWLTPVYTSSILVGWFKHGTRKIQLLNHSFPHDHPRWQEFHECQVKLGIHPRWQAYHIHVPRYIYPCIYLLNPKKTWMNTIPRNLPRKFPKFWPHRY